MKYSQKDIGPIRHFRVVEFEELHDLIENKVADISGYVFRGQSNATWKLEPTLNRLIEHARATGVKQRSLERFVHAHLDRFRLEIRGRRGDNPPKLEEDELWALGQHFGLATPLLDWSLSPYISAFFALGRINDDQVDRVLWCLHRSKVNRINEGLSDKEKLLFIFPDSNDNKRLLHQSGLFSKGPVMKSVDDWVSEKAKGQQAVLLKIVFPGNFTFRKKALKKLQLMNINHSTLFPDLSGASQFCNIVSEDYEI
jgi:hypothetical protein